MPGALHDTEGQDAWIWAEMLGDDFPDEALVASGEWDESKHPRDHGRFSEKEGDESKLPEGWRQVEPADSSFVAAYRSGRIVVSLSEAATQKVPTGTQHVILARLAALSESDPTGQPLKVNILSPGEMRSGNASGETFTSQSGASVVELNAGVLAPEYEPHGDTVYKRMDGVGFADYLVAHEYGHALEGADVLIDLGFARERIKMMKDLERPSAYGDIRLTNEYEAYAEAFADWRLNSTPGPLARALAEHDGWGAR